MCPAVTVVMVNMFETSNKVVCLKAERPGWAGQHSKSTVFENAGLFCHSVFYLSGTSLRDHFIEELYGVLTPVCFAAVGGMGLTDLAVSHTIWTKYNVQTESN